MRVLNIHGRELSAGCEQVGALIDSLASETDALWPRHCWPRMEFDRPLSVGADGGHGPVRYVVEHYEPGHAISFSFRRPQGFDGSHGFEIVSISDQSCVLRHTVEMTVRWRALISWSLVFRPMHDALIEDSLAVAQVSLGVAPEVRPWSSWVRCLRWMLSRGRACRQTRPRRAFQRTARAER